MYDLKLSGLLNAIKLSRAASRVMWLKADETKSSQDFSSLRTRKEMVLETLVSSASNHLTRLAARESFIEIKITAV
jgi:hypothetical protein